MWAKDVSQSEYLKAFPDMTARFGSSGNLFLPNLLMGLTAMNIINCTITKQKNLFVLCVVIIHNSSL